MTRPESAESRGYAASAWLLAAYSDLQNRGLLEGQVRDSARETIRLLAEQGPGDPATDWHVELIDLYEELLRDPA
ncbi:hypothetical protein HJD18_08135 [Thermoleophilia bacterium SCSIO 60948]|nr:hypothetical protein HJD18_08135 [Thermoleophilia bacterium SCSIO 60948]